MPVAEREAWLKLVSEEGGWEAGGNRKKKQSCQKMLQRQAGSHNEKGRCFSIFTFYLLGHKCRILH